MIHESDYDAIEALAKAATRVFSANPDDPRHGTRNCYVNLGCRCDRCRAANATHTRQFLQKRARERAALLAENERLRALLDSWGGDADGTEPCQRCGRYNGILWHAPQPLWQELNGRYGGLMCPRCFNALAEARGIWLTWTPVVRRRDGVMTTNWWDDPIRDRLLMGEPDPHFHDDEKAQVPQGHWGEIAVALGWAYETPYPDENRMDRMPGVVYRDSGVSAEAEEYRRLHPEEHRDR